MPTMRKLFMEGVRLLVRESGRHVWKTFQGGWLCGMNQEGMPYLGIVARERKRWGDDEWFVLQSAKGTLVVYRRAPESPDGVVTIFDSVEEMQAAIPENVFELAATRLGLRPAPEYPEEPLDI